VIVRSKIGHVARGRVARAQALPVEMASQPLIFAYSCITRHRAIDDAWIVAANVVLVGDKSAQWLGHHSENAIQDNERNCDEHSDPRFAVLFAIQIKQLNVVLHEHTVFRRLREAVNGVLQHRLVAAGRILDFASKLGIGSGGA